MGQPDIFLSYNREDAEVVRRFAQGFEAEGFEVWWDQALRSGEAYDEVTEAALRNARAVVVLWSPRSVVSRWVRAEASIADENGTLTPVKIAPCDLPVMFRLTQTSDLSGWQGGAEDRAWQAFLGDVRRKVGKDGSPPAAMPAAAPANYGIPVVAILPIVARGGAEELDFLAEDLSEDITRELAGFSRTSVLAAGVMAAWRGKPIDHLKIGAAHDATYIVESRLQRAGETIRLTMQLIDARTASALWSGRVSGNGEDIATAPDKFVSAAVSTIGEQLLRTEISRAMAKTGALSGWEHTLRSSAYNARLGSDSAQRALEEGRRAVAAAPELGIAHAALVVSRATQISTQGIEPDEAAHQEIREHITRAMQLDGNNPRVMSFAAVGYAALGDVQACLRLIQRAIALEPYFSVYQDTLAFAYAMLGRTADAIAVSREQDRLGSESLVRYSGLSAIAMCHFVEGEPGQTLECCDRSLALHPDWAPAIKWKAIASSALGDESAALAAVRCLREVEPGMGIENHIRQMTYYTGLADRLAESIAILRHLWDATEGE